jgi:hypothetical protein
MQISMKPEEVKDWVDKAVQDGFDRILHLKEDRANALKMASISEKVNVQWEYEKQIIASQVALDEMVAMSVVVSVAQKKRRTITVSHEDINRLNIQR